MIKVVRLYLVGVLQTGGAKQFSKALEGIVVEVGNPEAFIAEMFNSDAL